MIFGLPWTVVFGLGSLLLGSLTVWMAVLGVRDVRNQQGKFSKRHQAAFGHWKITRALVRLNSWTELISLIAGGPLLIGVGIWLMRK
jgi:hypothetical protein